MIDAHIHADCRPYEDFEIMAIAGVEFALTLAHDPLQMSTSAVVLDHFQRIIENDFQRAGDNGLILKAGLGLHPRSICKDYKLVLQKLPEFLAKNEVIALGEVGLETASKIEREVFTIQLHLADELGMKVVVHTPRRDKRLITAQTLSIIEENINPSLVLVDHVDKSIVDLMDNFEGMLGITVQPQKMNPQEAVQLLEEYGTKKFVLDSDMSSSPSDPLSVPKTVHKLRLAGFGDKEIFNVSHRNAKEFYDF
jgi:uncharacterized protein